MKRDKGVAGLSILLSVVVLIFMIGLVTMLFVLFNGSIKDATTVSASASLVNETLLFQYNGGSGSPTSLQPTDVVTSSNVHRSGLMYSSLGGNNYSFPNGFGSGGSVDYNTTFNILNLTEAQFQELFVRTPSGNNDTLGESLFEYYYDYCGLNEVPASNQYADLESLNYNGDFYLYGQFLNTSTAGDANCLYYRNYDVRFFKWNGSDFIMNDSMTQYASYGAPTDTASLYCSPSVFNDNGVLKLIRLDRCLNTGVSNFSTYSFDGSSWNSDDSVKEGLNETYLVRSGSFKYPRLTAFVQDGVQYLSIGKTRNVAEGDSVEIVVYNWNGTTWNFDSSLSDGINSEITNSTLYPIVLTHWYDNTNSQYHMLTKTALNFERAYLTWNSTGWEPDANLESTLVGAGLGVGTVNDSFSIVDVNNTPQFLLQWASQRFQNWSAWGYSSSSSDFNLSCYNASNSLVSQSSISGIVSTGSYSTAGTLGSECLVNNQVSLEGVSDLTYTITGTTFTGSDEFDIPASNYTISSQNLVADQNSPFIGYVVNFSANYDTTTQSQAGQVAEDTNNALAGVPVWFGIIIVITAMVVLILLTVLIINAIRNGGLGFGNQTA